jgi:hypothetical protein
MGRRWPRPACPPFDNARKWRRASLQRLADQTACLRAQFRDGFREAGFRAASLRAASFRAASFRAASFRAASFRAASFRATSFRAATVREPVPEIPQPDTRAIKEQDTMQFHNPDADFFVPDGTPQEAALKRTTHLCVSAHQDDIEIMAYHGIAECFGLPDRWFSGVVVTNGAGSPRSGIYGHYTDDEMQSIRRQEQRTAAYVGGYACMLQLGYPSSAVKDPEERNGDRRSAGDLPALRNRRSSTSTTSPTSTRPTSAPACARWPRCAACRRRTVRKKSTAARSGATSTGCPMMSSSACRLRSIPTSPPRSWASSTRR